jgi:HlyD family secretion protein
MSQSVELFNIVESGSMKPGIIPLKAFGGLLCLLLAGCSVQSAVDPASTEGPPAKIVQTAAASLSPWASSYDQAADVLPALQLDILSKAEGDVVQVLKKKGELVQEGDIIIQLDKTDMERQRSKAALALQSAEEQLLTARRELADSRSEVAGALSKAEDALINLQKEYSKLQNDYDSGFVTKHQLEQFESQVKAMVTDIDALKRKKATLDATNPVSALELQVEASRIALADAERMLEHYDIKAPASGLLTEMPIETGMVLPRGFKVGALQQQSTVKLRAELTSEMKRQAEGRTEMQAVLPHNGEKRNVRVTYLASAMNPVTKTYTLELEADNTDAAWAPGSRAILIIAEGTEQQSLTVPAGSVFQEGGQSYLFTLNGTKAEKRIVTTGREKQGKLEILSGLKAGEPIVVVGHHALKDGENVVAEEKMR